MTCECGIPESASPLLATELCGVPLRNPMIAASGTFGFGREYDELYDIACWGAIAVKGLTLHPREGNPPPRIVETASGMLNSVGLQNPGVDAFLRDELPWLKRRGATVIANVAGSTVEDYCESLARISDSATDLVELNISCPNVKEGGVSFGTSPESVAAVTAAARKRCRQPLVVKLTPNVADIGAIARAAEEAGADAVSLINTLTGMAVDAATRKPLLANVTGGLSGPAVKPVALRMVWQAAQAVRIPVVGMGGIHTGIDMAEFLIVGARAVMIGTANIADPCAGPRILREFAAYLARNGIHGPDDLVGSIRA